MFSNATKRTTTQKIIYIILPILSLLLIVMAYAFVQRKLPMLLPDAAGLWNRFTKTFTNQLKT